MTSRPYFSKTRIGTWNDHGTPTPGIKIYKGAHVAAHLTANEAIQLANRLVDLTEQLEATS